jgi:hypothetical protein
VQIKEGRPRQLCPETELLDPEGWEPMSASRRSEFTLIVLVIVIAIIAILITGCARRHETVLGQAPETTVLTIASVQSAGLSTLVAVRGTMVEK